MEPITITLRDDIANNLTKLVGRQVQSQLNHRNQAGPAAGTNYKFSTLIEILDGNSGNPNEQWQLEGCFVQNADYSQSDYSVSDPVTIALTLQYDNAVFTDTEIMPDTTFTNNSSILWLIRGKLIWLLQNRLVKINKAILSFKTIKMLIKVWVWRCRTHYLCSQNGRYVLY